jgi:outer membrane murein-binding lipoprotein Lpp
MATDRAAGVNSLKAELEMLENDVRSYREIVNSIALEDIVGIYIAGGRQRWRAEQIAKEDLEDLEKSLKQIEDKAKEMTADVVYGFEDKN